MEREVTLVSVVVLGRIGNNVCIATDDLHNSKNPAEVQRLQEEHPGEDDLVQRGRSKGQLGPTRACLKPLLISPVLSMMWGSPISPSEIAV